MFDVVFVICVCIIDILFLSILYYKCCMSRDDNEYHESLNHINSHLNPQHQAII